MPAHMRSQKSASQARGLSNVRLYRKVPLPVGKPALAAEGKRRLRIRFYRKVYFNQQPTVGEPERKQEKSRSPRLYYKDFFIPLIPGGKKIRFYRKNFGDMPSLSLRWGMK
jgi:hypothetical protein